MSDAVLTVGSLCSGVDGIGLGLERAGMQLRWLAEVDPLACAVLERHWPGLPNHGDITAIDWSTIEPVDLVTAGYPCQPFSTAGRMAGADDPRHLWPYVADAIRALRPRFALLENVPAHLGIGFDTVLADLASLGFNAEWSVVPASAMGAPQRRPRLFVVAYRQEPERFGRRWLSAITAGGQHYGQVADAHRCRTHVSGPGDAGAWTVEPDVGRMADGVSTRMDRDRLYALGNAVVPQVAEWIGRRIVTAQGGDDADG